MSFFMEGRIFAVLTREIFGNVSDSAKLWFWALSALSTGVLAWGVARRVRRWRIGKSDTKRLSWRACLVNLWQFVFLQRRVRGHGAAGAAHILLFGGFVVLSIGTGLIGIEHGLQKLLGHPPTEPVFHKGTYFAVYEFVMDLAGLGLLAGCGFFLYRRWKRPPEVGHEWQDWLVLALFVIIGVTGYALEGLRIVREQTPLPGVSFVGVLFARAFESLRMTPAVASDWHIATWWFHAVLALTVIALFPYTRLLHGIAGTVRLAAGIERLGRLSPVSTEEVEQTGEIGVTRVEQFKRWQLIELDACVSCGRCEQQCPAFEAGKPLSPRSVVQDVRQHFEAVAMLPPIRGAERNGSARRALVGEIILDETLWSCTTCSACVDVCPLGISPLGFITDMRRSLVADGKLRGSPAQTLQKTGRTGNPWGMPAQGRMTWADGLRVPNVQENPDYDVLYWVGCAAAYDRRLQKVARSVVKLMQAAGVNFSVLGNSEGCTGEAARRMGDELLFQQLAGKNIETFERLGVRRGAKRIVSHCPHCVNSFRQDYSQLGADLDVTHHTEFLDELIRSSRLKVSANSSVRAGATSVTYHDPCYLARVQNVTAAPRALLSKVAGENGIVEMPRHGRQTSCCGAGGGRMWFDDTADKRVGQSRVAEALNTGARTLAVSCPFCLTMTRDGIAARSGNMVVRDIAEILADALPSQSVIAPESTNGV
jgi:Fe-S oxidoreductase/nitrate reductase gamma subunit